ncbi:sigma-70 family RNA polymerase sigma factor [Solibacillus sp. MA9]|uniref:Sigma-70 family RNA polymerase sigma factor n=1 Tax=Solibacillus palustris TaxID=2908203 RepID=A0ABS9UGD7_9BACL|nr:sigma-70 family RNA polymerase sigma factor [Solibacillus sp. MA9]MCH7323426.1 sigma-70 family RNA polymerase sigma factor [Solibacillus sp. MA9]
MQQKIMALSQSNTILENIETIISSHYDKIYKYCYSILRNVEDAEDAVQEVFLKAMKSNNLSSINNPNAWLYKVAYFHCMNKLKRKKILSFVPFIEFENTVNVVENEQDEQLHNILNQLKPDERALVVLRIIENYSFEEIAAIMDKPAPTIRKRYERLKEKIRKMF